jgi:hypothetical protein
MRFVAIVCWSSVVSRLSASGTRHLLFHENVKTVALLDEEVERGRAESAEQVAADEWERAEAAADLELGMVSAGAEGGAEATADEWERAEAAADAEAEAALEPTAPPWTAAPMDERTNFALDERCFKSAAVFDKEFDTASSKDQLGTDTTASWQQCCMQCTSHPKCTSWSFGEDDFVCFSRGAVHSPPPPRFRRPAAGALSPVPARPSRPVHMMIDD